jgi:hypothetical protein
MSTKKANLSFRSKILITSSLIIAIFTLCYYVIYNNTATTSSIKILISSLTSSADIKFNQCHLSMNESDGWFCELDSDWKRRKMLHHIQDKHNRISDSRTLFFQNNWEPTIQCAFERRLGRFGDGGKWVCDIHRFEQINNNNTSFLIYSLGSNGDFSFEQAIKEQLPNGEIHTFDMNLYKCPANICTFHQARLGDGKGDGSKSLQTVMKELGHQKREVHILKVDIEGSEFNLFEQLFQTSTKNESEVPFIRQILFEIHLSGFKDEESSRRTHHLFELFRLNNYAIFHKEANLFDPKNVFEYALLRLNRAFFISSL